MDEMLTIGEAAKFLKVHVKTLQRWDRDAVMVPMRTATGRRVYPLGMLKRHLGLAEHDAQDNSNGGTLLVQGGQERG